MELSCSRRAGARRDLKLNPAQLAKASHDRLTEVGTCIRFADRVSEDGADLGLHRPAVPGSPDAEQFQDPLVDVPDAHCCHGHHLLLLSMLACGQDLRRASALAPALPRL